MFEEKLFHHYKILVKIFELDGFIVKRTKGDHIIIETKAGIKRPLVIKSSPKQSPCNAYSY